MKKLMAIIGLLLATGTVHTVEAATFRLDGKGYRPDVTWGKTRGEVNDVARSLSPYREVNIPPEARWILVRFDASWGKSVAQKVYRGDRHYQFLIDRPAGKNVHVKITNPIVNTWRLKPIGKVKNNISGKKIEMLKKKDHIRIIFRSIHGSAEEVDKYLRGEPAQVTIIEQ